MALAQPETFSVSIGRALGRVILTLHGELDTDAAPVLRSTMDDVIQQQGNLDVIIDLAHLELIDSGGLDVLVAGDRMAKEQGGTVTLSAPRPPVQRVFELAGLAQHLTPTKT